MLQDWELFTTGPVQNLPLPRTHSCPLLCSQAWSKQGACLKLQLSPSHAAANVLGKLLKKGHLEISSCLLDFWQQQVLLWGATEQLVAGGYRQHYAPFIVRAWPVPCCCSSARDGSPQGAAWPQTFSFPQVHWLASVKSLSRQQQAAASGPRASPSSPQWAELPLIWRPNLWHCAGISLLWSSSQLTPLWEFTHWAKSIPCTCPELPFFWFQQTRQNGICATGRAKALSKQWLWETGATLKCTSTPIARSSHSCTCTRWAHPDGGYIWGQLFCCSAHSSKGLWKGMVQSLHDVVTTWYSCCIAWWDCHIANNSQQK